jgi:glycosyltransferase involved in cell wall biosynthesis
MSWLASTLVEIGVKEKFLFNIEKLIFPFSIKKAKAVVSVSNFVQTQIESVYNIRSRVIYHGIDSASYTHTTHDKSECKERLQIDPQEKIILYVGKLHPYKDPLTLLNSFGIIARKLNKTRLVLIGEGKLRPEILKLAKNLQISDKVSLYGQLNFDEFTLLYRAADVFVLPSRNEAFGIVILEAMASGTPPIVSNSGAGPEIIQNCGLVFEQGNYRDLAEKILQVLEDENLARTLALRGYERVKKVFSWEKSVAQYEKLYSHLIK